MSCGNKLIANEVRSHQPNDESFSSFSRERIRCSGSICRKIVEMRHHMALARIVSNRFSWKYLLPTSNDTSDHTRVCGSLKASLLTHPTQAIGQPQGLGPLSPKVTPMQDRLRPVFPKGPRSGGGGKVVSVTEIVTKSGSMNLFLKRKH